MVTIIMPHFKINLNINRYFFARQYPQSRFRQSALCRIASGLEWRFAAAQDLSNHAMRLIGLAQFSPAEFGADKVK
jgi:hypothetical protein